MCRQKILLPNPPLLEQMCACHLIHFQYNLKQEVFFNDTFCNIKNILIVLTEKGVWLFAWPFHLLFQLFFIHSFPLVKMWWEYYVFSSWQFNAWFANCPADSIISLTLIVVFSTLPIGKCVPVNIQHSADHTVYVLLPWALIDFSVKCGIEWCHSMQPTGSALQGCAPFRIELIMPFKFQMSSLNSN